MSTIILHHHPSPSTLIHITCTIYTLHHPYIITASPLHPPITHPLIIPVTHIEVLFLAWQRELLRECVESNPGPAMVAVFSNIANQFGEEAKRIREDLQKIEVAIKKWKPSVWS